MLINRREYAVDVAVFLTAEVVPVPITTAVNKRLTCPSTAIKIVPRQLLVTPTSITWQVTVKRTCIDEKVTKSRTKRQTNNNNVTLRDLLALGFSQNLTIFL